MKLMTIGKIAESTGLGVETVRFYERQGLIDKPSRKSSGYRQFSPQVIPRLHFIKQARELGFSLEEIRELFALKIDPSTNCEAVRRRVEIKRSEVEEKIAALGKIRGALGFVIEQCGENPPEEECPFLDALDSQDWDWNAGVEGNGES